MRATVVLDLQLNGVEPITGRLVSDVLVNLQGLCVVATDEPVPFFVEDYRTPAAIRSRHLLTTAKGILDLDAIAAGQAPEHQRRRVRRSGPGTAPARHAVVLSDRLTLRL
jgi:hypothetical protein